METSYLYTPNPDQLIFETLHKRLLTFATKNPEKQAFVFYSEDGTKTSITCKNLYEQAHLFAKGLITLGIKTRDVVGISFPNCSEWLVCHFGVMMAGGIPLGLYPHMKDGDDLHHVIKRLEDVLPWYLENIIQQTDQHGYVQNSKIDGLKFGIYCGTEKVDKYPFTLQDVLSLGQANELELPFVDPDDIALIFQTSGTTGKPKLVPKTHFEMFSMVQSINKICGIVEEDVYFSPLPFIWAGGYVNAFLLVGCTIVTVENFRALGDFESINKLFVGIIARENCNIALMITESIFAMMNQFQKGHPFPLKTLFIGGHPIKKNIAAVLGTISKSIVHIYAGTEFGAIAAKTINNSCDFTDYNCGAPVGGLEIKIVDKSGTICPRNETGTIFIRPRLRFQGYLNEPAKTNNILKDSGWVCTEDIGYITDDSELICLGRQQDVIAIGGLFISPYWMESLLLNHADVQSVAIIAIPDTETFQQMCACIVRKPGSCVSWKDIEETLRGQLTVKQGSLWMSKVFPKYHVFMDSFPVNQNGKLVKSKLISQVLDELNIIEKDSPL